MKRLITFHIKNLKNELVPYSFSDSLTKETKLSARAVESTSSSLYSRLVVMTLLERAGGDAS